ncbi:hypothetical protein CPAR01_07399 [Colletotrichum paranaense]|uniref:Secreted protein n=2 Tax=Colletotrichum acutatum species complex TaxID=2707335 RepID=A0AAI9U7U8_9PEZI|nr:uncharacterized protein CPAR01_07399 [Colletotrichum paranaense]KAK1451380.1 hypothetical protein CMEL01_05954 [Colletotrichum melonis]KAK1541410.1 hypothetical protein CPAR01_07399 [Colletotrichum paranaense]
MRLFVFPILALAFPGAMLPLASSFPLTPPLARPALPLLPSAIGAIHAYLTYGVRSTLFFFLVHRPHPSHVSLLMCLPSQYYVGSVGIV